MRPCSPSTEVLGYYLRVLTDAKQAAIGRLRYLIFEFGLSARGRMVRHLTDSFQQNQFLHLTVIPYLQFGEINA